MRNEIERTGEQSAMQLEPLRDRIAAAAKLLTAASEDVQKKINRARTACAAYRRFEPSWAPREQWADLRQESMAMAAALKDSSCLGRAADELEFVRSTLGELIAELRRLRE